MTKANAVSTHDYRAETIPYWGPADRPSYRLPATRRSGARRSLRASLRHWRRGMGRARRNAPPPTRV